MALKVYYLRQLKDTTANREYTEGEDYISLAINEATDDPSVRRVIIEENPNLEALALKVEEPTEQDMANYNTLPESIKARDLIAEVDDIKKAISETTGVKGIARRLDEIEERLKELEKK